MPVWLAAAALSVASTAAVAIGNPDLRDPNVGAAIIAPATSRPTPPASAHKACGRDTVGDWDYVNGNTLRVLCNGKHGQYERTVTR